VDTPAPAVTDENPSPPQWFVIRIQPQAESVAAHELGLDGFQVFFPQVATVRAQGGRSEAPLFPGYLFLQCHPEMAGRSAFRPGHRVAGWVNFSGLVPSVPDEVIAELMLRVERINRGGGLWRRFQPGETVNVVSGNVETLAEVVAEAKSPQGRVRVLLSFMGRLVEAQVPRQRLWPAQGPSSQPVRLPRRTRGRGRWIHSF
jgi:transcriptional antiterminator RfaH